jgi:hypothetical protein
VGTIGDILSVLKRIADEEAIMVLTTQADFATDATIAPYQSSKPIAPDALIEQDLTNGTITIGYDGWYEISGYVQAEGAVNNQFYGSLIDINSGTIKYIMGVQQWTNTNPGMAYNATPVLPLSAGDVIKMVAYSTSGNLTVNTATLSVAMESL